RGNCKNRVLWDGGQDEAAICAEELRWEASATLRHAEIFEEKPSSRALYVGNKTHTNDVGTDRTKKKRERATRAGSRRQDTDKAAGKMQNAVGGLKDAVRGKQRASTVNGACHGNDFNNRCVGAAVWRRRRILGSQSGLLVIRFCAYARAPRRVYVQSILNSRGVGHI
ncbi:MAG TPA: hypothetical protein VHD36_10125, partial [Pirellulales bacterium]|nr:hypothetical protein [Pirellulales bacterium]